MELSKQIKKYRLEANLSQDELAEKIFVSRQTISNWENDKSYPDVKSLLLVSEVFQISLDNLIKGDVARMRKEIDEQERLRFRKDSIVSTILLLAVILSTVPLAMLFGWYGIAISVFLAIATLFYGLRVARYEKKYDIETFKDILVLWEQENSSKTIS
ncbi:TPA: helix-turn-helix transcriptional regulator [Clostridioides difficile]|nr:helix-turn-helix transcriptional regulator [Clostridioides difficile]HBH1325616.1 helix-turn-helix transcriptional regulator [Clostridioides difficile]